MKNKIITSIFVVLIIGLLYLVYSQLSVFRSENIESFKAAYKEAYPSIKDISIKVNFLALYIDIKSSAPIDETTRISMIKSMEKPLMKKEVFEEIDNYIKKTLNKPEFHYIQVKFISESSSNWYEVVLSGRIPSNEKSLIHVFSSINELDMKSGSTISTINLN